MTDTATRLEIINGNLKEQVAFRDNLIKDLRQENRSLVSYLERREIKINEWLWSSPINGDELTTRKRLLLGWFYIPYLFLNWLVGSRVVILGRHRDGRN